MSITETYRRQSFSLNDLGLLLKHNIRNLSTANYSSSEGSFDSNWHPAYPHEPAYPPPARIKTPEGFPSFGTREAQLLRLEGGRSSRASLRFRSWRYSRDDSIEQPLSAASPSSIPSPPGSDATSQPTSPPTSTQPQPASQISPNELPGSRELFRRTLAAIGMSRMMDPDPIDRASSANPRISSAAQASSSKSPLSLPPWVFMTNIPGPLARADDGTYMRGAFGPRASGHGVGGRSIEALPLARVAKMSPAPAAVPATLANLRSTDAASGRRSTSAIGAAIDDPDMDEKGRDRCDKCCERCWLGLCCMPR